LLESHPTHPGLMASLVLVDPLAPPVMRSEEAIGMVKANYGYTNDMPDSIWRSEFGSY
jgi:hypothetical protein